MPKLNLRTARRIKTASGEVLRLKGHGFEWPSLTGQVLRAFGADLQGMWDFTDPASLYQDAAGTLPVTAFGDAIGLAVDKGPHDRHLSQATTAARPAYTADGAQHDGVDDVLRAANVEDWAFLHDGSGGAFGFSGGWMGVGVNTFSGTAMGSNTVGVRVGLQSSSSSRGYVSVNAGEGIVAADSGTGSWPENETLPAVAVVDMAGFRLFFNGPLAASSPVTFPPSPAPPASAMTTLIQVSAGYTIYRRRMFAVSRIPTEPERALLNAWLMEGVQ